MFNEQFYIHNDILYQGIETDEGNHSISTLVLWNQELLDELMVIIGLLLEIYQRISSVRFLRAVISTYMLEIDEDIILIYPYGVDKSIQENFLELLVGDLYELNYLLNAQICDAK